MISSKTRPVLYGTAGQLKIVKFYGKLYRKIKTPFFVTNCDIIVKADLQGSLDALVESLNAFNKDGINIALIHHGVGNINENDIHVYK